MHLVAASAVAQLAAHPMGKTCISSRAQPPSVREAWNEKDGRAKGGIGT
jgi:hypothetical protein